MEYYINEFQQYIKSLCSLHQDILHNDENNVAFVRFQSHDDLNQVTNQASPVIVIINRFYGKSQGGSMDDMAMKQFVQIRFAVQAIPDPVINWSDVIAAAGDKAFKIMLDFISRFKQDVYADDCGALRGIELENCSWSEIPDQPYLVAHYGWDLSLPFNSEFPEYNPDKWAVQ